VNGLSHRSGQPRPEFFTRRFLWLAGILFVLGVSFLAIGWHLMPRPPERDKEAWITGPEEAPAHGHVEEPRVVEETGPPSVLRIQREVDPSGFQRIIEYQYWSGTAWTGGEKEAEIFPHRTEAEKAAASLTAPPAWEGITIVPSVLVK
jgi:hypothetical protein